MARLPSFDPRLIGLHLQAAGPLSTDDLAARLKVERSAIQRALRNSGPGIVRLGTTRGTRYALERAIYHHPAAHCLMCIGSTGVAHEFGRLTALHGGWRLEWAAPSMQPDWADQVHDYAGFCEGLPFFLSDLRPQGFLGRAAARRLPDAFGLPLDPRNWNDDQTLLYLREWGDDLPGNFAIGEKATKLALDPQSTDAFTPDTREARYVELATLANSGEPVGSSVEGEQPKFTTWLRLPESGRTFAVLVKFTDILGTPTGRRWADLLAAEAIALDVLTWASRADAEAPHPHVYDFGGRRFYELPRFDRIGQHGRRGVVSLRALHDAGFTGPDTNNWVVATTGLRDRGWISASDLRAVRLRALFGRLIGNTDMHFGNLAFYLDLKLPLELAPAYDILPMLWAPRPGDATPLPEFAPSAPLPAELDLWPEVAPLAETFWQRVAVDPMISPAFQNVAHQATQALHRLRQRFG